MPRIFEWKCSYYNDKDGKWLYGHLKLLQRFLRFKPDAGNLAMRPLSIDMRNITGVKRRTTNLFFNALTISERGVHVHWFSSLSNVYDVLNIVEHFWKETLLGPPDNLQRSNKRAKSELLEIAYESQTTLMSAATTLHAQGEQIQDAAKKMDMLHADLQIAENIVSDMESWFGYWKIKSSKDMVTRGQDFKILVAKSHQESHTSSKLILGAKSIDIYDTKDKLLHTFSPKDLSNTLVHSPYDITLVKRSFGKPDVKAHVIATKLPILLNSVEKIYKQKLILEDPPLFNGDDSDDYDDTPKNDDDDTPEAVKDASDFCFVPNVTENRNKLLAGSRTQPVDTTHDSIRQQQIMKTGQEKVLTDADADELSGVLKNMKEMALDIGHEQELQNEMLDKLGMSMESAESKVRKDNKTVKKML